MSSILPRAVAVLEYWFGATPPPTSLNVGDFVKPNFELWFGGTPEIDKDIGLHFSADVQAAMAGFLDSDWGAEKYSTLALIILLDQMALNIFRDKPESFQTSAKAIPHVYRMIEKKWDVQLPEAMRMFVYLPLEHSEVLKDQERCVELFEASMLMEREAGRGNEGSEQLLSYAVEHRDIVRKYGRFPGRNSLYGRESTPEELDYLKNGGVF